MPRPVPPLESPFDSLTLLERCCLLGGILVAILAVPAVWISHSAAGVARAMACAGIDGILACAALRGLRLYRAGVTVPLPESVARVRVRIRPARGFTAVTVTVAFVLPVAAVAVLLALLYWSWLPVAAVLVVGALCIVTREGDGRSYYREPPRAASELLQRLCMRADIPAPELVVEGAGVATAWTSGGRIRLSPRLLELLDESELEAVMAHELAHLARRDAAVMEISSAPSRVLLGFAGAAPGLIRSLIGLTSEVRSSLSIGSAMLIAFCLPFAFVLGWVSRLSLLVMSRAREFAADAAAVTLTGKPSALASALMKLERQGGWAPSADMREVYANAMLCIVGPDRRGLGRLLSTHPPVSKRVERLRETESRLQAGPYGAM